MFRKWKYQEWITWQSVDTEDNAFGKW
jgi:hypothetical protein